MATSDRPPVSPEKLWTPANVVTLVRICLVPVFVAALLSPWPEWFGLPQVANDAKSLIAAAIFILISCTDWLDGYLARSRNEVTDFGKFMDPLADKILVVAALFSLVELGALPSWVALIIVTREFIVSGVRMMAASAGTVIAASWYGKFKTVFQMIAIVLFTVKDNYMLGSAGAAFSDTMWVVSWGVMLVALALTVVSMLDYIAKARHLIGLGSLRLKSRKARASAAAGVPVEASAATGARSDAEAVCAGGAADDAASGSSDVRPLGEAEAAGIQPEALEDLACEVLQAAREAGKTVGTAESLTGGLVAAVLTQVPGSSASVAGGVVSYAASVKRDVLAVEQDVIDGCGVVSEETARAMAAGACATLGCDTAVAVTGIAGPGGAEPGKPVGTVWLACADAAGGSIRAEQRLFDGTRDEVRLQTVRAALELLLDRLRG